MDSSAPIPNICYRAPSQEESGIEVLDLERFRGRLNDYHFNPYQPHRVSYFCFLFIDEGEGEHLIDFHRYPYRSGSVIFVNPNQVHAFDSADRPKGKMINITTAFFSDSASNIRTSYFAPFHQSMAASPVLPLNDDLKDSCKALLTEVRKAQHEGADDDVVVQLLISSLLIKLGRRRQSHLSHLSEHQKERFDLFLTLVEQCFPEAREASHYADLMHTSYKTLNQLCKTCCGRTAKQLIDFRTILEIKRKLVMDGLSSQEIASDLSFEDISYMNKYFKRLTGQTPAAFKRDNEC
ncbi:AraC family transcriptional regulator [Ferrimonas kyonanensis]|uniref:AraC family transcriptional regulator n=1 Tax=Ferrimonas kyonanensis TaxID=364763 RepID=UPI0004205E0E|nr:helix-turn-helix transcriptional regulator [Ferrimonas kyonanensis]